MSQIVYEVPFILFVAGWVVGFFTGRAFSASNATHPERLAQTVGVSVHREFAKMAW